MPDYTVTGWCVKHRCCRATFYNLRKRGKGPQTIRVGDRIRITEEADAAWVEAQRAAAELENQSSNEAA